jgi:hypothetical protein
LLLALLFMADDLPILAAFSLSAVITGFQRRCVAFPANGG